MIVRIICDLILITYFFFWLWNLFHWKPTHFVGYAQLGVCLVIHDPGECLFLKEFTFLTICFCPSPRLKKSQEHTDDWYRCTKWHMFWCNFPERSYVYPPGSAGLELRRIKSESNGKPGGDLSSSVWHVTISNGSVLNRAGIGNESSRGSHNHRDGAN